MPEPGGGAEVVGFRAFGAGLRERIENDPQMGGAGSRQKPPPDGAPVDQQSRLVASLHHRLRQRDPGAAGLVELRQTQQNRASEAASRKPAEC